GSPLCCTGRSRSSDAAEASARYPGRRSPPRSCLRHRPATQSPARFARSSSAVDGPGRCLAEVICREGTRSEGAPVADEDTDDRYAQERPNESPTERLDRNWNDILQELRVVQTGVQLLTGFLLTLPFQQR